MNMVRIKKILILTTLLLLALGSISILWAGNDLLSRPADKVKNLDRAVYMDIARVGNRIVAVGALGAIAYTDDQGKNWRQAAVPTSVTLTAVDFVGEQLGWAVGHDGIVLHSKDAGANWQKLQDGNDFNQIVLETMTRMVDTLKAELATADDANRARLESELENLGYLLDDARFAVEDGPTRPFMDVWFANEREGLIVGAFGMIFRTEDGGKSWTALNDVIENPDGYHYYGLAATRDALLLVGETGIIYRSFDQGRHWESLTSPYAGSLFGIVSDPAGDRAIAVGLRGNAVEITDKGESMRHLVTPSLVALNSGTVQNDGSWVLVGLAGQAMLQSPAQDDFTPLPTRFPGCLSVVKTSDNHLVLAGMGGVLRIDPNNIN